MVGRGAVHVLVLIDCLGLSLISEITQFIATGWRVIRFHWNAGRAAAAGFNLCTYHQPRINILFFSKHLSDDSFCPQLFLRIYTRRRHTHKRRNPRVNGCPCRLSFGTGRVLPKSNWKPRLNGPVLIPTHVSNRPDIARKVFTLGQPSAATINEK